MNGTTYASPVLFFSLRASSFRLSREIAFATARPVARIATPSHQHLCFPLYRAVTSSTDASFPFPFLSILPRCVPFHSPVSLLSSTFPFSASLSPPGYSRVSTLRLSRSPTCNVHEKKNGEKRPWLEMESLATHPRLIPLFSRKSSVARRSESPSVLRSECGRIKLGLQRMIGRSLTLARVSFSNVRFWSLRTRPSSADR